MGDEPSERLIDQRVRNRIIEVIGMLADGDDTVLRIGPHEYFEAFFDWVPVGGLVHRIDTLTVEETAALTQVTGLIDQASDDTPRGVTIDQLIASGWPTRIALVARRALALFLRRGRFSEDVEETEPSHHGESP